MGEIALNDDARTIAAEPAAPASDAGQVLAIIKEAATNPNVDVAKMSALLDMQERVMARQALADFERAFAALQAELPTIRKGKRNTHTGSSYATWDNLHRVIKPLLIRHGFTLRFETHEAPGGMQRVEAVLTHASGHRERSGSRPLPADKGKGRNDVQAVGSTQTYGTRYATVALLGMSYEDDDDAQSATAEPPAPDLDGLDEAKMQGREVAEASGTRAYRDWWGRQSVTIRNAMMADGSHDANKATAEKAGVPF